jgi:hypothetical protein
VLPIEGASSAAVGIASSAAAAVAARRRQRKLLLQQQLGNVAVANDAADQDQQQQQPQVFSHDMQDVEQQQQDRLSDSQLKPALQQLLQQMQDAHSSIQQHQFRHPQQHDVDQQHHHHLRQQQLTAVAQLTDMIQSLQHPKQLLTVLLVGRGALNVVHYTSVAGVLVRMAQQSQRMQQDPTYRTKVRRSSRC